MIESHLPFNLADLGLTALRFYFSLYRAVSQREAVRKRNDRREKKMSKHPQPAPTASAVCTCPTIIQIARRPGTGSLPRTIAPPDHPLAVRMTLHNSQDESEISSIVSRNSKPLLPSDFKIIHKFTKSLKFGIVFKLTWQTKNLFPGNEYIHLNVNT